MFSLLWFPNKLYNMLGGMKGRGVRITIETWVGVSKYWGGAYMSCYY